MPIWCLGIDTGYSAQDVYDYALRHPQPAHGPAGSRIISYRTVVPIKGGHSATKLVEAISDTDSAKKRHGLRIVTIGATAAKQIVFDSLWRGPAAHGASVLASEAKAQYVLFPEAATATATEEEDPEASAVPASDSTAGMIHFPADYGETYFKGLCAEERFLRRDGTAEFRKKPGARNEPLDLAAYNRALAELCGISRFTEETWDELEARRKAASETVTLPGFIAQQQAPRREIRGRFQI